MLGQLLSAALVLTALSTSALAKSPVYPLLKADDSWKYAVSIERGGVKSAVGSFNVSAEGKNAQGGQIISNRDPAIASDKQIADISHVIESDVCMTDLLMQIDVLEGKLCAKPLRVGQKWRRVIKVESGVVTLDFKYVGLRDISVPAGTFSALFIECENTVRSAKGTVRMWREFWYSPAVRGMVAMSNQVYDETGAPSKKYTYDLIAFTTKEPLSGKDSN